MPICPADFSRRWLDQVKGEGRFRPAGLVLFDLGPVAYPAREVPSQGDGWLLGTTYSFTPVPCVHSQEGGLVHADYASNPAPPGSSLVCVGSYWDTALWLLLPHLPPSWELQAQGKHMSLFSSTATAYGMVSFSFILKVPSLDGQLCGRPIQDPLKSCLMISGSKERWSYSTLFFLDTTQIQSLEGFHALLPGASYPSSIPHPSEISR